MHDICCLTDEEKSSINKKSKFENVSILPTNEFVRMKHRGQTPLSVPGFTGG